jgi:hypothetical protein
MMEMQQMMELLLAKMDANSKLKEEIRSGQAEIRFTVSAIKVKLVALLADIKDGQKERATCQEETKAYTEQTEPNPRMITVHWGESGGPQGKKHSEIFGSNEEAAQGPASGRGPPPEAEGEDLGKLYILEGIDRHRQRDDPWCKSCTAQGTSEMLQGQGCAKIHEGANPLEETKGVTGM